jgi:hypothetical protein
MSVTKIGTERDHMPRHSFTIPPTPLERPNREGVAVMPLAA